MATNEDRDDVARQMACMAYFVFARAGPDPPIPDGNIIRIRCINSGVPIVLELESIDSITISGTTHTGEIIDVSSNNGFDEFGFELGTRSKNPETASAQELEPACAASG